MFSGSSADQLIVKWLHEGLSLSECARRMNTSRQALTKHIKDKGLALPPIKRGRKQALSDTQRAALTKMLSEGPLTHGFRTQAWTRIQVQTLLRRHFGVQISLSSVSSLMNACGVNSAQGVSVRDMALVPANTTSPVGDFYGTPSDDLGLFTLMAEHLPLVVIRYDRALRRTYVNSTWCRVTGYRPHEVIGKTVFEVPVHGTLDPNLYVEMLTRVSRSGISEKICLYAEGQLPQSIYCLAHYDVTGFTGEVICISCRGDFEETLPTFASNQLDRKFNALNHKTRQEPVKEEQDPSAFGRAFYIWAEDCGMCVMRFDAQRQLLYANSMAGKFLGLEPQYFGSRLAQSYTDCRFALLDQALHTVSVMLQPEIFEMPMQLAMGGRMAKRVHIVPELNEKGALLGLLVTCRDLYSLNHPLILSAALANAFKTTYEESSDCVITFDGNGRILHCNASAETILDLNFQKHRGCIIRDIPKLRHLHALEDAILAAKDTGSRQYIQASIGNDTGGDLVLDLDVIPCESNAGYACIVAIGKVVARVEGHSGVNQ